MAMFNSFLYVYQAQYITGSPSGSVVNHRMELHRAPRSDHRWKTNI